MPRGYKAFISYSHEDEVFGSWLHKELEKYKIPKKLREDYPNLPKTLYPIFRDRYELNAGDDLGVEIPKALENSDALIVVCSTKSADSKWVNKEIIDFKIMHGEDKIFPIILDGEPFARESDKFDDELECFPEALKYKVDSKGNLTNEQTSILASSAMEKEDGRELAKLKLIAGVLGVSFGEFYRRDEEQKKKDKIKLISIWSFVSLVIIGFAVFSWIQRDIAIENEKIAQKQTKIANKAFVNNLVNQGITLRKNNNNSLKAKHIFAKAVLYSNNKRLAKKSKILYNSIQMPVILDKFLSYPTLFDSISLNKDENKILSWGGEDNDAKLREINSDEIIQYKHDDIVAGAIMDQKETKILTWSWDKTVKLWDMKNNKELLSLEHNQTVQRAAFSKKGKYIFSWSGDFSSDKYLFTIWSALNGKKVGQKLVGKINTNINDTIIKNNEFLYWHNNILASGKYQGTKNIVFPTLAMKHNGSIINAKFNENKNLIASWALLYSEYNISSEIKIWDGNTHDLDITLHDNGYIKNIKFNRDTNEMISWGDNINLWDFKRGKILLKVPDVATNNIREIQFSKDAEKLWIVTNNLIKNISKINAKEEFILHHNDSDVYGFLETNKTNHLISWGSEGNVKIWKYKNTKVPVFGNKKQKIKSKTKFKIDYDYKRNKIKLLDNQTGEILYFTHKNYENAILNKAQDKMLSWGKKCAVKLWDINRKHELWSVNAKNRQEMEYDNPKVIFNHDETKVIISGCGNIIDVWDIEKNKKLFKLKHQKTVQGTMITKKHNILSWGIDSTIRLWDHNNGKQLYVIKNDFPVLDILISKNENELLAWGESSAITLWNLINNTKLLFLVYKDADVIYDVKFNRDETLILSFSNTGELILWDKITGVPLLKKHFDFINNVFFSSDESHIIVWDADGKIKLVPLYQNGKLLNQYYPLEVEVESGTYLDKNTGEVKALRKKQWLQKKKKYEQILKDSK